MKCKYCGKEIKLDLEGDWIHSRPKHLDLIVCYENGIGHIAEPEIEETVIIDITKPLAKIISDNHDLLKELGKR